MANVKSIISLALKKVVPSALERKRIWKVIDYFKIDIENQLKKMGVSAEVFVGGSIAKGTWIKNHYDIDFFVRFDGDYKDEEMSRVTSKVVKKAFGKCAIVHGSRDYCKVKYKNYLFEFIPTLKIAEPRYAKNSIDASIFHVDYIKSKISKSENLANQIRLFKAFLKAQGVYGAETYISGFSGYVAELLMVHYGSFENLAASAENMKPQIFIDLEKHFKSSLDIRRNFAKSKLKSPIVVVDPVLKRRNASAALSYEMFSKMILALRLFSRNPSISFFNIKPLTLDKVKKMSKERGTLFLTKKLRKKGNEDVFMAKVKKGLSRADKKLRNEGINVYNKGCIIEGNNVTAFLELETLNLSKKKKHYGPPVWANKSNFDAFLSKWSKVYADNLVMAVDVDRTPSCVRKLALKILREAIENV